MRTPLLATLLLATACSTGSTPSPVEPTPPPKGKPDANAALITAKQFVRAISRNDDSQVRVMLASSVQIAHVELVSDSCRAQFEKEQTVSGDQLDALAKCLVELAADSVNPGPGSVTTGDGRWHVELELKCASYKLELTERGSGLGVTALAARSNCGGTVGGVEGVEGVDGDPSRPPPPPPAGPKNVPPKLLDSVRISGSKYIVPDDHEKAQMPEGSRLIGSFKLCLDVTGAISQLRMLKSTGFVGYDAKLAREIAKWRHRPYLLDGKAVPVCTAVTFIYSQTVAPPAQP